MDFRMCITRMILTEGHSGWCRGVGQRRVPDQCTWDDHAWDWLLLCDLRL